MADFYLQMQQMARDLLAPTSAGGLGQGTLELEVVTPGVPDPDKPWEPVAPSTYRATVRGAARGVGKELIGTEVGGTVILGTDLVVITEVPPIPFKPGDTILIDNDPLRIISFDRIPAAGVTAAVRFIVRG